MRVGHALLQWEGPEGRSVRLAYYKRVLQAYLGRRPSHLSFWHGIPELNEKAFGEDPRQFYMRFHYKACYAGTADAQGIPLLDYRGAIGPQYNPIAVAQWGLGCWNLWCDTGDEAWLKKVHAAADWLVSHLEPNARGLPVWMHHFDWEYFRTLKAPWYSGLAQGQGIALLVRVRDSPAADGRAAVYGEAAREAFRALVTPASDGGTLVVDESGRWWVEEYLTEPPTHILNGMIWALWGVHDLERSGLAVPDRCTTCPRELWEQGVATLRSSLFRFDCGYWSLYDLSPVRLRNVSSPFYHALHIVQLRVMARLTGEAVFAEAAERWQGYAASRLRRRRAWAAKALFKLAYF